MVNEIHTEDGAAPHGRAGVPNPPEGGSAGGSKPRPSEVTSLSEAAREGDAQAGTARDDGTEAHLWAGRTDWRHYAGRLALWLVANTVAGVVVSKVSSHWEWMTSARAALTILALVVASGLIVGGGVLLRILGTHYRLTDQRLFIRRGILSQTNDQLELIRVDDVRTCKTFLGRLLRVGTIIILTTDATDKEVRIEGIREPDTVAEDVRSRMRKLRGKSLFVETL